MGCFDTVIVPCPVCGTKSEFQSKSGLCLLATYELADAPADVLEDVNRHAPNTCEKCGTQYGVKVEVVTKPVIRTTPIVWPARCKYCAVTEDIHDDEYCAQTRMIY